MDNALPSVCVCTAATTSTTTTSVTVRTVCLQVSPSRGAGHHEGPLNSTSTTMSGKQDFFRCTTTILSTTTTSATTNTLTTTTILTISLPTTSVTITPIQTSTIATTRIRTTLQYCQWRMEKNVKELSKFKYLGSILSSDNTVDAEVESRINRTSQVFRSISRLVWYQPKIKVLTKLKLFKAVILPTLLYGSETWNLLQHNIQRLQVFVNRCLRIITGTSLWEKMRNTQLRNKANIDRVDVMIQKRRL